MTTDKLAEALRRRVSLFRKFADDVETNEDRCVSAILRVAAAQVEQDLKDHAAEAAQPAAQAEPVGFVLRSVDPPYDYWPESFVIGEPQNDESETEHWEPLYTHPPAQAQDARDAERVCGWTEDEEGNWDTGCGHLFVVNDGTPHDNGMRFCCFCGNKLEQETFADAAMAWEGGQ